MAVSGPALLILVAGTVAFMYGFVLLHFVRWLFTLGRKTSRRHSRNWARRTLGLLERQRSPNFSRPSSS
jgi:hypothetical protein